MKTLLIPFLVSTFILCSFLNIGNGGKIEPRNFLDDIIKDLLNSTFQDLKNLTVPEIAFKIDQNGVNVSFSADNLEISNLENIEIEILETGLIPIKVKNITLKLDYVNVTADAYDLSGVIVSGSLQGPVELFGNGKARIDLENIFLTAAIDFTSFNNSLQIKENGIHGFDFYLEKAQFGFENLLGDPNMGEVINVFLSYFLPYVVADFKQQFFDTYEDQIIDLLNEVLKNIHF